MNDHDDDRLSRYLSDRADTIPLTPGDPSAAMRRGTRRRTRRRGALVGGVAVIGLLATSVVVRSGDDDQKVRSLSQGTATPSTYDWSVIKPGTGLGYSGAQAQLASGSVYGLSTAPGPYDETSYKKPQTLYRSDDGTSWVQAKLPSGLSPSALSASGDTLYALGTAPAGGGSGRDLVVAASTDGAASWTSITLPHEVADLEARHPGQISLGTPTIAAKDAAHQVASIVVSAKLDPATLRPELANKNYSWDWSDTGVTVYEAPAPCDVTPESTLTDPQATSTTGAAPTTVAPPPKDAKTLEAKATGCRDAAKAAVTTDANGNGPVIGTYTWDQLGVDAELRGLVQGRTYTYVTDDGAHYTPVTLPTEGQGWGSALVAGNDGYTLFFGKATKKASTTDVLHSADGHTWAKVTSLSGSPMSAGLLSGRPAVAINGNDGQTTVQAQQADGSWMPLSFASAVPLADGVQAWTGTVAFGPLGVAGTVTSFDEHDKQQGDTWVVHSTDGVHLSVQSIRDKVPAAGSPIGVTVTADAIDVRLSDVAPGHAPTNPPTQTVLVGTPTG